MLNLKSKPAASSSSGAGAVTKSKGKTPPPAPLEENPAVSAFLSPKSRIFAGGHARGLTAKQLTPQEVANKIASMLKPGPPFFSRVSNADLLDFIADQSIMNCDALREQVQRGREARRQALSMATFATSSVEGGGEEEEWDGVGTVWSALEALPAGAGWGRIPGAATSAATISSKPNEEENDEDDDGLWSAITLTCDIECTSVRVGRSVVVPTQVLESHHFFSGNSRALVGGIGAGSTYSWDDLRRNDKDANKSDAATKSSSSSSSSTGMTGYMRANYLSLDAYTHPEINVLWKWPSWMPFFGDKAGKNTPLTPPGTTPPPGSAPPSSTGGQKRIWVPSTTKVSLHASWWGFNIYLPAAILRKLDGDVEEAEKIANLVNKCLTYILNNIPSGLPTALGTVITILKAIAPTTGYISTFIGWSWDTIKSFDKGEGVVLSATWILPVALIPRSWDAPTTVTPPNTPVPPADSTAPGSDGGVAPPNGGGAGGGEGTIPAPPPPSAGGGDAAPSPSPAPAPIPSPAPGQPESDATTPPSPSPVAPGGGGEGGDDAATAAATPAMRRWGIRARALDSTPPPSSSVPLPEFDDPPLPPSTGRPAPGATLPPSNPGGVPIDLSPSPTLPSGTTEGDKLGRAGELNPQPPMGSTPAPAGQVPIDAES